jgi:hypothetical protein
MNSCLQDGQYARSKSSRIISIGSIPYPHIVQMVFSSSGSIKRCRLVMFGLSQAYPDRRRPVFHLLGNTNYRTHIQNQLQEQLQDFLISSLNPATVAP